MSIVEHDRSQSGASRLKRILSYELGWFGLARSRRRVDQVIAESSLPEPTRALVRRVVKQTRLWRREQADVARELVAHFEDGLASGAMPIDLEVSFGDARHAARLIRRAKIRQRGLAWHSYYRFAQALGCLIVVFLLSYLYLGVRVWTTKPRIAHDYLTVLNAEASAVPDSDRAWPLLRQAMLSLTAEPDLTRADEQPLDTDIWAVHPGDAHWDAALAHLKNNQEALAYVQQATTKKHLGYRYVWDWDAELEQAVAARAQRPIEDAFAGRLFDAEAPLYLMTLPHARELRVLARMLAFDIRAAAHQGDASQAFEGMMALQRYASLQRFEGVLVSQIVGLSIRMLALQTISEALHEHPGMFSEEQLALLAHEIAASAGRDRVFSLDGEAAIFHDSLQRTYTDDGRGGGAFMLTNYQVLVEEASPIVPSVPRGIASPHTILKAFAPLAAGFIADRRSLREMHDRLLAHAERIISRPLWESPRINEFAAALDRLESDPVARVRFFPLLHHMPSFTHVSRISERFVQQRDALLVAIGLEIHRQRHGGYPETIDALIPALLPAVPPDRHTGKPLNYVLKEGKPLLYSVGIDLDDDGGIAPAEGLGLHRTRVEAYLHPQELEQEQRLKPSTIPDGDWILYPPQPRP